MTSQSPRIYIYKITFEEVPYYYYGSKKEKYYNQEYWGSPVTHKWMWKFYTPKKQILQLFDTREEANAIENRIIKHFINDPYCLNENCGGIVSLSSCIKGGLKNKENGTGICGLTKEQRIEAGKKGGSKSGKISGKNHKENGTGIFAITGEEKIENCKKGGNKIGQIHKENGTGICGIPIEERRKNSKKGGKISGEKHKKNGTGVCGRSKEKMTEDGKRGGKKAAETNKKNGTAFYGIPIEERRKNSAKGYANGLAKIPMEQKIERAKKLNTQKWMCNETGYITTSGPLTKYQRARGIDTSKRVRIS
jgi:hypothetical protein